MQDRLQEGLRDAPDYVTDEMLMLSFAVILPQRVAVLFRINGTSTGVLHTLCCVVG